MSPTAVVFKKELREMMRDKRVRSAAFVGPVFMIFLFMMLFGVVSSSVGSARKTTIHYVATSPENVKILEAAQLPLKEVASLSAAETLVRDGKARVVVVFDDDFAAQLQAQKPVKVTALYDDSSPTSQLALNVVQKVFEGIGQATVKALLMTKGVDPALATPVKLEPKQIKVGEDGKRNDALIGLLPYLIVIWAFYGGFGVATELVAGEKEKNTLETLLITPVGRNQIALGKFLALSLVALVSSLSSVFGVVLVYALNLPMTRAIFESGLGIGPATFGVILAVLVPTVALFSGLLLAVSAYAKNSREAQTYLTLLSFLVLLPAVFSQIIGFTDFGQSMAVNFIPVLNTANTIRNAMLGKIDGAAIAITVAISLVIAAIAMGLAIRMFGREEVLNKV